MTTDVWITGLGAVGPLGNSANEIFDAVVAGKSGIGPLTRFPTFDAATSVAGVVPGVGRPGRDESLAIRFGVQAVSEAMVDAGLSVDEAPPGAVIAANHGEHCPPGPDSSGIVASVDEIAAMVAKSAGCEASFAPYGACASGLLSIGTGVELIQAGLADRVVAGGTDCLLRNYDFFQFCKLYAMSSRDVEPTEACCPFDSRRDGFVLSEGAAFVVLESEAEARRRGAEPKAVVAGYGYSQNAFHMVASPPDARGPELAIRRACEAADGPTIDYINAHGTSTRDNDWCETLAIRQALGSAADDLWVSSSKSQLGHLMAAAGAIETVISVLALQQGVAPPTINLSEPDPRCDLDYVPHEARSRALRHVLTNSFGFGGHNASMVLAAA